MDKNKKTLYPSGIRISPNNNSSLSKLLHDFNNLLEKFNLNDVTQINIFEKNTFHDIEAKLQLWYFDLWCPGFDTLQIRTLARGLGMVGMQTLEQEILLSMLAAPQVMKFASVSQLESHIRVRVNIAEAASKTSLAFNTEAAERPQEFWRQDPVHGFVIRNNVSLIDALIAATQPGVTGKKYEFSCYRAAEYLVLLGLAKEARRINPMYLNEMEKQCRLKILRADPFHSTYLCEYGTPECPIPMKYYVPGDRLWFKNPDNQSSNVKGFEGSWVFYLGGGLFSNFWENEKPFDLVTKCLEIYHWRNGICKDSCGVLSMDEDLVYQHVINSKNSPEQLANVLSKMMAYRDPAGVYENGGCIDSTREIPRPLI